MNEARVVVSSNQISTDLGDEIAILNLDSGVYYGLSDVGACIWNFMVSVHHEGIRMNH